MTKTGDVQELENARQAMESDPLHAIGHLAIALAQDPGHASALELLERALSQIEGSALEQYLARQPSYFGLTALRAYAFAWAGRFQEAFPVLADAVRFRPAVPYLLWLQRWISRLDCNGGLQIGDPEALGGQAVSLIRALPLSEALQPGVAENVSALAEALQALTQRYPNADRLHFAQSFLFRCTNRWKEAQAAAQHWFSERPSWISAVETASAHRGAGELEIAASYYRRAIEFEPEDPSTRLDLADVLLDGGCFEEAAQVYEEVLRRKERHPWAEPSALFSRWMSTQEECWKQRLLEVVNRPEASERAHVLASLVALGESVLPPLQDHSLRVVQEAIARFAYARETLRTQDSLRLSISTTVPEAPSVSVAFGTATQCLEIRCDLIVSFQHLPEPDPRQPRRPVSWLLWSWGETGPRAALEPPQPEVAAAIAQIANQAYHLPRWREEAAALGRKLGAERTRDVLACMVQPPLPPNLEIVRWLQHIQIAAALVLASLEGAEGQDALHSALFGPADWTVGAAALAVAATACAGGDLKRRDAERRLLTVLEEVPPGAFCTYEYALLSALLFVLSPPAETRRTLWRRLRTVQMLYGIPSL